MTPGQLVGRRVKEARNGLQMSQKLLGQQLKDYLGREWSPQAVSVAEHGGRQFYAAELLALSAVLEQPVAWFLTPESRDQIQMPGGRVVGQEDLFGGKAAPDLAGASLAVSEQAEESLTLARSVVRELEKLTKARVVLSALSSGDRTGAHGPSRAPHRRKGKS
jgi:transcriptional regulator with XRE-family HTH domain